MSILEGIGGLTLSLVMAIGSGVGDGINHYNDAFVERVDSGVSCWERVAGEVGEYGDPSHYNLKASCVAGRLSATPFS